jgi:RNA polymerase sigma factor (sigma-70 family)
MSQRPNERLRNDFEFLFARGSLAGISDSDLVERLARGPGAVAERAFEALVVRHGPSALRVCRRFFRDPAAQADAFEATLLILLRGPVPASARSDLGRWLCGVAGNVCRRNLRSDGRRRHREGKAAAMATPYSEDTCPEEWSPVVRDALESLPEECRRAMSLHHIDGLTVEATAAALGRSMGSVRHLLRRGVERLRSDLISRGLTLSAATIVAALEQEAKAASAASGGVAPAMCRAARVVIEGKCSQRAVAWAELALRTTLAVKAAKATAAALILTTGVAGLYVYQEDGAGHVATRPQPSRTVNVRIVASYRPEDRENFGDVVMGVFAVSKVGSGQRPIHQRYMIQYPRGEGGRSRPEIWEGAVAGGGAYDASAWLGSIEEGAPYEIDALCNVWRKDHSRYTEGESAQSVKDHSSYANSIVDNFQNSTHPNYNIKQHFSDLYYRMYNIRIDSSVYYGPIIWLKGIVSWTGGVPEVKWFCYAYAQGPGAGPGEDLRHRPAFRPAPLPSRDFLVGSSKGGIPLPEQVLMPQFPKETWVEAPGGVTPLGVPGSPEYCMLVPKLVLAPVIEF